MKDSKLFWILKHFFPKNYKFEATKVSEAAAAVSTPTLHYVNRYGISCIGLDMRRGRSKYGGKYRHKRLHYDKSGINKQYFRILCSA
jgi:hypothetical protein